MPILPNFSLSQDEDFVMVTIRVPHVRVSKAELIVEGRCVFVCVCYVVEVKLECA